ncbi:MAG: hypothetical protein ACJ740_18150 [Gaiellales bacterium]
MRLKLMLGISAVLALALVVAVTASRADSTPTIRGMVGGDFDTQLPPGGTVGADWGTDASFPRPANNLIHDGDVKVVGPGSGDTTDPFTCSGSAANPTAPRGKVCVYVIGSGNATNIRGVTPVPGTGGSRFGFKLIWDATGNGDTFVDAVWAYHFR